MADPSGVRDFLGRGWAFPVASDPGDEIALVAAEEDIREAILLILQTEPGERLMRPDFGCPMRSLLFEPINQGTIALARHRIEQALVTWEPRIDVTAVTINTDQAARGLLQIEISYVVRSTNTFYNLVYPFYLKEGGL